MAAARTYHVGPDPGGWKVTLEDSKERIAVFLSKLVAVSLAERLASGARKGRVVVHVSDGSVERDYVVKKPRATDSRDRGAAERRG